MSTELCATICGDRGVQKWTPEQQMRCALRIKKRWMRFYPNEWVADQMLCRVSLAARGLLVEILCLLSQSCRPGYLVQYGTPINPQELAKYLGRKETEIRKPLAELESRGLICRTKEGVIFSEFRGFDLDSIRWRETPRNLIPPGPKEEAMIGGTTR